MDSETIIAVIPAYFFIALILWQQYQDLKFIERIIDGIGVIVEILEKMNNRET